MFSPGAPRQLVRRDRLRHKQPNLECSGMGQEEDLELSSESLRGGQKRLPREGNPEAGP